MGGKPIPTPSILDDCEVIQIQRGRKVYRNQKGDRYYTWDSLHGEVESFNKRGRHLGALCPTTGDLIKPAVKGRKLDL